LFIKGKGKGSIGASIGGTINVDISQLGNSGLLEMAGGRIKSADVAANVLGAISVNIKAQSGADAMLAFNDAVDIPMEWRQPMPIYGIPLLWIFKFKLGVGPALSSKNSTLNFTVKADVGARGGIQFLNNLPFAPASLNPKDPEYQIGGAGLGVLGFVITARPRINFGLGFGAGLAVGKPVNPADASATAFVDAVFSAGVTQGSPLGMIMCKNITVNMQVRGGFETKFLDAGTEGVKPITGDKRIFDKAIPEVKACHLG